ncbi:pre-mRNA-splicing factor CLF1 [Coprinopsis cinerea okayama7|uniref:Pre-mRNA-splicing factor CLF1 n=1 Tax=Coprinopsis cinerea (strain Okayama-7 / 130 / ATCC MYA-4618 / FGSC 9003) TaxID=240176 RepID=A8NCP3_COPC7|nr:pre-mRNA-splicing factor CLF1 [Coprinopsis cinerea okayama7\|eukprot:XP_001832587.1 pre-mRNA-splicing factor CLF1 [Coprinopsis cinerea okayama7\
MQDGRAPRIKNRAPAAIQITAEQLLREAQERQETAFRAPKQRVEDFEELSEYRGRKRKEFEERIRRTRGSIKEWLQYANWEASQNEFARSRSVFERALDVDPRSIQLWLSYTEMELKNRNVQHARNLFDRAVTLLPRVDQLWYKYVYLEELLQNIPGARQVFERWMQWEPDDKAWQAYIKLEERYQEYDRASAIYERWIAVRPEPRAWVKWAKFEEDRGRLDKAREVFQTALEFFGDDEEQVEKAQAVFGAFARMETRQKEYDRARVIYKFALDRIPRSKSAGLYASYTKFEKQHGTKSTLENTVLGKRRIQYEEELSHDGRNYDAWFDYTRLEEGAWRDLKDEGATAEELEAATGRVREVYERAVAQVPPGGEKRHWRRYIFLWLNYALFEEIETKDYQRAREIYQTAIKLVPHKQFTFAKLWLMYAKFEVRRLELQSARRILGTAIGMCPKEALFKGYIDLEIELREFDRVRTLYEKYLEFDPSNSPAWIKYAELEAQLQDFARCRAIFELGVSQSPLSMPEILWKAYIDFEIEEGEREAARALYERLIALSGHVKVWISYATFEAEPIPLPRAEREEEEDEEEDEEAERKMVPGDPTIARQVFERGYKDLKSKGLKDERVALLEVWKTFEENYGTSETVNKVEGMKPVITKRRHVDPETGGMVEDWDLVFPDDEKEKNPTSFKFLQMAHKWKQSQASKTQTQASESTTSSAPETSRSSMQVDQDEGSVASSDDESS